MIETVEDISCGGLYNGSWCADTLYIVLFMNVQYSLIWELMLYEFRLYHNAVKVLNVDWDTPFDMPCKLCGWH